MKTEHISVNDGKYTVVLEGKNLHVLKNGKSCSEFSGSDLIYWLAVELADARAKLNVLEGNVEHAKTVVMEMAR